MSAIKTPPPLEQIQSLFQDITQNHADLFPQYFQFYQAVDTKGRYLPFDKFRFRVPKPLKVDLAWSVVKTARLNQYQYILPLGKNGELCPFALTPAIQKATSLADRNATTAALEFMSNRIGEQKHFEYMLNDLVEDEAISSSQLEGAATTTLVAKDMLKRQRKPRTPDERMIMGNFQMMKFAIDNRARPLSIDFIQEMHEVGVQGIDDDEYRPGVFRDTDDVAVVDRDGEIVHQPPPFMVLPERLERLCAWVNECHDSAESQNYLHPLIKAMAIHFAIGYEHPFRDGNGRVARALFYWFMFKNEYAAFRYITISVLLKGAATEYGKSYLYTESDTMDLTYFLEFQCNNVIKAINAFKTSFEKSVKELDDFNQFLLNSGLFGKMNDNQRVVFRAARDGLHRDFTAINVSQNLNCSYNTAATVLKDLVKMSLFSVRREGKEWLYNINKLDEIKSSWSR